jgi:hypothetical protein
MEGEPSVLVDVYSATQGRVWDHTNEPLNRENSDLVKFHRYDEGYESVLTHLLRFLQKATVVIPQRFHP